MLRHIVRRLLQLIPLLLGITVLSFLIIQLSPGDFLAEIRLNPVVSQETVDQMRANFGLDQPLHIQYLRWLSNVVRGDFGYSFAFQVPVLWLIQSRLLNTLLLNVVALVIAWLVAVPIGIHAATRQYSATDNLFSFIAYIGISTPTFFSGLLLLYLAFVTRLLPIGGMTSLDYALLPWWGKVLDVARHIIIPASVLAFLAVAGLMRQMRANLLEVLRQDYVRTARSKGLADRVVIYKHAVRNAINPLITLFGLELGGLLSGSAILENVVGWPGLGQLILDAVTRKDLYVVMGSLVIGGVTLVLGNLVADILLAVADPRIRYD
ncbi:MAG: ABC transporter permease [Armatimonadota bacterium]|nr:ABC transporter permease [Armatimonadota bacterium]MDR7452061.1 ABC transporter permease [Armatimonadota bacterium]MDR7466523.1 ABC transporter permease [Armatimonadota bacterium]MDR7493245.1 ABC transporter permease [Armatimonadota bacterium]MDR7499862.1 ABC transporter permease [Armatimonadota bacterium]